MSASSDDGYDPDDPYFWFVNGAGDRPFNLCLAPGAVSFGRPLGRSHISIEFMRTLRRYSVMVCRLYWAQLG